MALASEKQYNKFVKKLQENGFLTNILYKNEIKFCDDMDQATKNAQDFMRTIDMIRRKSQFPKVTINNLKKLSECKEEDLDSFELAPGIRNELSGLSKEQMEDYDKALDRLIKKIDPKDPTKPVITFKNDMGKEDPFWFNWGNEPINEKDLEDMEKRVEELKKKGVDVNEIADGDLYDDYLRSSDGPKNKKAPLNILNNVEHPEGKRWILKNAPEVEVKKSVNAFLDHVEKLVKDKGVEHWADIDDKQKLANWAYSFKMPVYAQIEEKNGLIEFSEKLDNMDRDKAANYDKMMFEKAKKFYADPANKEAINFVHDEVKYLKEGSSQQALQYTKEKIDRIPAEKIAKINEYKHMLFQMKQNYKTAMHEKQLKLGDDKNPEWVDEFEKGDNLTADRINEREQKALDTCYDMLKNSMSSKWNSSEYKKIMSDVDKAKKILQNKELSPEEMQKQYKAAVGGIIGDIGAYYAHKAVKGETDFSTEHKYKVLYRVEKLMKSRYDGMDEKQDAFEADFNVGGAFSINDDDIADDVIGDEYAKQATQSKVKQLVRKKEQIIEGKKNADEKKVERRHSIGSPSELRNNKPADEIQRRNTIAGNKGTSKI
ncbi:MAG: hypothetical protein IKP42_05845 [Ruminococcus sp.]|nr:hypothetical protein [Ruminococcus sp.]